MPLCFTNWSQAFFPTPIIPYTFRSQFFLTRPPDPLTLSVDVARTLVPQDPDSGWIYDGVSNSILFSSVATPPPGATFRVQYNVVCQP